MITSRKSTVTSVNHLGNQLQGSFNQKFDKTRLESTPRILKFMLNAVLEPLGEAEKIAADTKCGIASSAAAARTCKLVPCSKQPLCLQVNLKEEEEKKEISG